MKTRTLLIAAVMFFGVTAAAFAQATFNVGSNPVTGVIATGLTEQAGAITFNIVPASGATPGTAANPTTITITYGGAQVTSQIATTVNPTITSSLAGGCTDAPAVVVNTAASSNANGVIVLNVSSGCTTGGFSISGVRVAVAGTSLTTLNATLSASAINFTANQTTVTVISSISAGIASVKLGTSASPATVAAATGTISNSPVNLLIKEGFLNAWGQVANGAVGLRITLSALPPAGITFTFPATAVTNGTGVPQFTTMNSDGLTNIGAAVNITSTSTSPVVYYKVVSGTDATTQETLTVPITVTFSSTKATLPFAPLTITASVSMAPIGTALNSSNLYDATQYVPRYAALDVAGPTVIQITASQTVLLYPFVQSVGTLGYNTGLTVANTTEDPGTATLGFTGAIAQTGTITFYFFPSLPASGTNPANVTYTTTAGSPGSGLDSSGRVVAGSTYTVLLTQLLAAAGQPTDFNGYVIAIANFTNAHGLFVVSNFTNFSQGGLALVMMSDRTLSDSLNN